MTAQSRQSIQHDETYWRETPKPLYCLIFILPMLVLFHWQAQQYRRYLLVLSFFHGFAACLPPLAIISVLLGQHLLRRDRWGLRLRVLGGMIVESVLWVAPLIAVSHITTRVFITAAVAGDPGIMIGIGGGIYEEFVFHLLAIGIIMFVFVDLGTLPKIPVAIFAVAVTAVLFALSHMHIPPFYGMETFSPRAFAFRMAAGLYLGALFLLRGFGVAVGTHVMWNIYVCAM
ncbi:MAG: hypothetical protein QGH60_03540 [Phycisphaerae bacterium]|jgi:hypothetical protein|nr:hypothetical protein [Phycisphaerae bacterium]